MISFIYSLTGIDLKNTLPEVKSDTFKNYQYVNSFSFNN